MDYHPEDFINLSQAVEDEGGGLLAEACAGSKFRLKIPEPGGKSKWHTFRTTRCGMSALFELPYNPTLHIRLMDDDEPDVVVVDHPGEPQQYEDKPASYGSPAGKIPKQHSVTVCAVDDAVGLWPRFAGVVSDRSAQKP